MRETGKESGAGMFPAPLRIESLAAGGSGLARLDGMAVFVPGTAPGDLVEASEVRRAPDYAMGRLVRVLEPSPHRRPPACPLVPECGGCGWQQVAYEAQLAAKEGILAQALERIGRVVPRLAEPIVPSPEEFFYRHRVQLKVLTTHGRMRWGFFAATSHWLVDVRRCLISHPAINALLPELDRFLAAQGVNPSALGCVELNVDGDGLMVECILHPRRRRFAVPGHGRMVRFPSPAGELTVVLLNATLIRRQPAAPYEFSFPSAGVRLLSGAGVFSQNNLALNPRLVEKVLELAACGPGDDAVDIYSGVGNYSIPLARRARRVTAVESNRRACLLGEENARRAGLGNVAFTARGAREALADLPRGARTLILNPPRVGAAEIMEGIADLAPERVVYVSCNPATLARDLAVLAARGWRLDTVAPFDMFPQTHHLETVALAVRG